MTTHAISLKTTEHLMKVGDDDIPDEIENDGSGRDPFPPEGAKDGKDLLPKEWGPRQMVGGGPRTLDILMNVFGKVRQGNTILVYRRSMSKKKDNNVSFVFLAKLALQKRPTTGPVVRIGSVSDKQLGNFHMTVC